MKSASFLSHDLSSFEGCVIARPDPLADPILYYCGILNNSAAEAGLSMRSEP
jgi:hypothetical protein